MSALSNAIYVRRELLAMLIVRNLKIRYKNSALGFFWSLLTPACFIAIYAVFAGILGIRGRMLGTDGPGFLPFLVTGIVVWQFTATCFSDALQAIAGNANLVKKAAFPRMLLPLSMVLANACNFLLTLVVLWCYLAWAGAGFGAGWLLLLALPAQAALCLGLALLTATANVFYRDTEHIVGVAALAWFFLTPVFYPASLQIEYLGAAPDWLAYLNPMTGLLDAYRQVFLGMPADPAGMAVSAAVSLALLLTGIAVFQSSEGRFGDEL
ncbi:MAG: ABC transporter permease [Kiritimatiellae bacterium]|nr:ABC transporter permease [Kiritimatiellia bacterium]